MSSDDVRNTQSRREFLATGGAVAGAVAVGIGAAPAAQAASPKRGGVLRFATRSDARGLDPHANIIYYVSQPLAGTSGGLLDIDYQVNPIPGIASEWSISKDLKTYKFKLQKGIEYHNGADVDAASVKWNYERILDPKIGYAFTRASLLNIERMEAPDKHTFIAHLKEPSSVFLSNVTYYPCNLIAPNSVDEVNEHPVGCGPFKFKSWKRFDSTVLERFENFWETGVDGKPLPYLDGMVGMPRKEDRVRFTALRAGEAHLIENMGYADAGTFKQKYGDRFNIHPVAQVGTGFVQFNLKKGPFAYSTPGSQHLRTAVAHAVDREAIHQAVFYGLSDAAKGFYSKASPWYMPELEGPPPYDPDKARFHMKKAGYNGEKILLYSRDNYQYMQQTGELVHALLTDAGFNVSHEIVPWPVLRAKYKDASYHIDSSANSYRPDPDGWFFRQMHSNGPANKFRRGYKNERVDKLSTMARVEPDKEKRRLLYLEAENIINRELPVLYTHFIPLTGASVKTLKDYRPAFPGPFNYHGGGVRTAWFDI